VAIGAAATAAYVIPPFGELGCRPPEEACLRRVAGSADSLASSVAFRFPAAVCFDAVVPRFRVGTAGRFLFPITAVRALKNSGEKFPLDNFLMMACCSSCDSGILQNRPVNPDLSNLNESNDLANNDEMINRMNRNHQRRRAEILCT
jgi:hypothetical protein